MTKRGASYDDMIDLPDDPGPVASENDRTSIQGNDNTSVPSYDRTKATKPKRGKRAAEVVAEGPVYVQRSLYATEPTFDRIRQYAFEKRRPAQELYREGLLLVMKKYGIDEGVKLKDV